MTAGPLLVTGGAGYVGSHVCVELLARGHELVVLDSLCNSKIEVLSRIEAISGRRVPFVQADVRGPGKPANGEVNGALLRWIPKGPARDTAFGITGLRP